MKTEQMLTGLVIFSFSFVSFAVRQEGVLDALEAEGLSGPSDADLAEFLVACPKHLFETESGGSQTVDGKVVQDPPVIWGNKFHCTLKKADKETDKEVWTKLGVKEDTFDTVFNAMGDDLRITGTCPGRCGLLAEACSGNLTEAIKQKPSLKKFYGEFIHESSDAEFGHASTHRVYPKEEATHGLFHSVFNTLCPKFYTKQKVKENEAKRLCAEGR